VGGRSSLFFEFARLLRLLKPRYFLLENIALMRKVDQFIISAYLNVKPILLDSALFSAQSRRRLYWTNIPLTPLPSPSLRLVRDILEPAIEGKPMAFTPIPRRGKYGQPFVNGKPDYSLSPWQVGYYQKDQQGRRIYSIDAKGTPLHSTGGGGGARMGLYAINGKVRPLTPTEAERLQTLPDQYTQGVSESQRFIMLGNAFTVEVIAHLFRGIEQQF
jgi:DNA (cytosine-5)-methyltransferase 3A